MNALCFFVQNTQEYPLKASWKWKQLAESGLSIPKPVLYGLHNTSNSAMQGRHKRLSGAQPWSAQKLLMPQSFAVHQANDLQRPAPGVSNARCPGHFET